MSQKCPHCRLISPQEAVRCDCGYDFVSNTIQNSYLRSHALTKHGGKAKIIQDSSDGLMRVGLAILGLAVFATIGSLVAGHNIYFWLGGLLWGTRLVSRAVRQRRQNELDSATLDELMKRS